MFKKAGTVLGIVVSGLVLSMLASTGPVQAAAVKAQSVFVANTPADPVPTRDTKQQYTTQVGFVAPADEVEACSDAPPVPEGKRMIVDTVVAEVERGQSTPNLFLYGVGARPFLSLTKVIDPDEVPLAGAQPVWGATEQLHLIFGKTPSGSVGVIGEADLMGKVCVHPKGETRFVMVQFNGVLENL
jgi:hypothetical protein